MSNDPLLQPYQLKHLTLRNRIMTTSHEPAYPEDGMPKERYAAYHAERAKAGVALAMTAGSAAVSKDSPPVFNNILAYKDEVVPWIKQLTDACHDHGCAVMIQLTHLGRRTRWDKGAWLPSVSSTMHREPAHRAFPKRAEDWDIERIITDFADATERMKAGGMDGIELQVYGHLLDQFWSPLTNDLDGPYGGQSLDSRMKLLMDVLTGIRKRVGNDFIVGLRYTADEAEAGGITPEEGIEISRRLADCGMVDFLNVIRGRIHTDPAMTDVIPVQGMKNAPHLDFAGEVKKATGMPTFHAAKIPDVATARHAVQAGLLDMVGMTRAHMADPHIVKKIVEGREDDIRPCVGATYCLDRIYAAGEALCVHNAATGRELIMPHEIAPAETRRRVVIIGAGPAGLEAARVAAERGHHVTVFEVQPDPGGQVRLTAQNPRRREMISIIDWRMAQCAARDVEFRFNTWAEAGDVTDLNPDVVIVATGGLPNTGLFEDRSEQPLVVSAWDLISGDVKPGQDVLVYDESGDHPGLMAAEIAASAGAKVEVMTPDRTFAPDIMAMNLVPYMRALQDKDTTFTVTRRLKKVEKEGNRLKATIDTMIDHEFLERAGEKLQRGVFQCTLIGILAATAIQLNAIYLKSDGATSLGWLAGDFAAGLGWQSTEWEFLDQSSVSSLTSSILLLLHVALFGVCTAKVRSAVRTSQTRRLSTRLSAGEERKLLWRLCHDTLLRQLCTIGILSLNFALLGQFVGFTLLLSASIIIAVGASFWSSNSSALHHSVEA